jgi:hypothetical protein
METPPSSNRGPLHGLAEILAQAPLLAAAFGRGPGFALMVITISAVFTVSLATVVAIVRAVLKLFG